MQAISSALKPAIRPFRGIYTRVQIITTCLAVIQPVLWTPPGCNQSGSLDSEIRLVNF
jgi:hypothetical protein